MIYLFVLLSSFRDLINGTMENGFDVILKHQQTDFCLNALNFFLEGRNKTGTIIILYCTEAVLHIRPCGAASRTLSLAKHCNPRDGLKNFTPILHPCSLLKCNIFDQMRKKSLEENMPWSWTAGLRKPKNRGSFYKIFINVHCCDISY